MGISVDTYKRVALEDVDEAWELECGRLRRKPAMTIEHGSLPWFLARQLTRQLDDQYLVGTNSGRLQAPGGSYYIPDLVVLPVATVRRVAAARPRELAIIDEAVPLVVEVWSPSTGDYDATGKLRGYQQRGDAEIWLIHPYDRTLTAWRRQSDGTYTETLHREGVIEPISLPGVRIDLTALFS